MYLEQTAWADLRLPKFTIYFHAVHTFQVFNVFKEKIVFIDSKRTSYLNHNEQNEYFLLQIEKFFPKIYVEFLS